MPSRERRAAARRSQLTSRKKNRRGPSGLPIKSNIPPNLAPANLREGSNATAPRAETSSTVNAPHTSTQHRTDNLINHQYVAPELRRILILSSTIIVALIVLAIFIDQRQCHGSSPLLHPDKNYPNQTGHLHHEGLR